MTNWRKNLYDILDSESTSVVSVIYNWVMLIFIIISLITLAFREQTRLFFLFDRVSVVAFIID